MGAWYFADVAYHSEIREEKKRETRRNIVDAAIRLFVSEGFDAPSLDAICAAAGVTRGAYYVHFKDRDELACAAMEQAITDFMTELFRDASESSDPLHFADAFLDAIAEGSYLVGGGSTRIRFHHLLAACAKHPPVREQYLGLLSLVAESIREELAKAKVPDANVRAETCIVLMMGLLTNVDLGRPLNVKPFKRFIRTVLLEPAREERSGNVRGTRG